MSNGATKELVDSRRMLYFYHVARLRSFTLAEAYLDVAQPAISRQIQQLEEELGAKLLQRNGRGVSLTDAGRVVYERSEDILDEMAEMRAHVALAGRHPSSQVSVAAFPSFMTFMMPEAIKHFIAMFPDVHLKAYEASTGQVYNMLLEGQVDLAVVLHAPNSQKLSLQKLSVDSLVLAMSPGHPLAANRSATAADLAGLPLVLPASAHGSRILIDGFFAEAGVEMSPRLEFDSLALTFATIAETPMCTILPAVVCQSRVAAGELVTVPLSPALTRTTYLASLRDRPLSLAAKALAREIGLAAARKDSPGKASGSGRNGGRQPGKINEPAPKQKKMKVS